MKRVAILLLVVAVSACGGPPPPPPPVLTLTLTGGADQNTDPAGHPTSVAVHLYQLASPAKFEQADVFSLLEKDRATLGDDLAASETVLLPAGGTQSLTRQLKPGVQALGVAVAFRDIDHATWRLSAPVKPSGPTVLDLQTSGIVATLKPGKAP